ncbi:MAG: hypothetical protein ABI673_02880 [Novosphingobium sp.]
MSKAESLKTARLDVGIWYNQASGHIHIAAKNQFISTVSNDPSSKRYHPNLYRKLSDALRNADKPHPNPSPEEEGLEECS